MNIPATFFNRSKLSPYEGKHTVEQSAHPRGQFNIQRTLSINYSRQETGKYLKLFVCVYL